jgi:hypothetical protein
MLLGNCEDMRQETLMNTTIMFNATSPVAKLPRPSPKLKAIDFIRSSSIHLNFGIVIPSLVTLRLKVIVNGFSIRSFDVISTT